MQTNFDQSVAALSISPLSSEILQQITVVLEQQTNELLPLFISQSFQSLLNLERWAWKLLSYDSHQWIDQSTYRELFHTLASFNKNLIFTYENIEVDIKVSLLFPITVDQVKNIFELIKQSHDDNDPFIIIISLWFDNHSHFLHDNPQYNVLATTDHINQYIVNDYIMNKQYKIYLNQLRQPQLAPSIFTAKMLFYIKTCSFYLYSHLIAKAHRFSYTADELIRYIADDYLQIIHVHSSDVASWNKELLACIAHLVGLIFACCWWNGEQRTQMKILFPTEQITCDHVTDLIHIIAHEPFYKETKSTRSNGETMLMDSVLMVLIITVQSQNISWFFRSNTTIRDTIISVAELALNDEICLCGYAILGEVLTEEQLKDLKIASSIGNFFLNMLEEAWHHTSKKYKQLPIEYLLKGFHTLSKNECMQQRTVNSNKMSLFIEMCDQYSIVFDIIWALSFNPVAQQQLRSSASFMSKLSHREKEFDNEQMRKITHGILWNLEINHEERATSELNDGKPFDIMISYSHKEKVLCKQLYEELTKAGYRVWIDFDQLHGNVMDAMAQAIERSHTIIICMSEHYRRSNYCRAEAHYAFQRQRKIVPVLLQKHYRPDGWLLFLIGQLLYVDFIKYEFALAMKMLMKELKAEDIREASTRPVSPKEDINAVVSTTLECSPMLQSENILEWTQTQVQDWLLGHNLTQMSRLFADCDGRSLVYLHKYMKHGPPQQILILLQDDSRRRANQNLSLIELSCFHSLMDKQKILRQSTVSSRPAKTDLNSD